MTSQTEGIQQLLAAEKVANDKVSEARKRKMKRLKEAKDQAQDEIDQCRNERDKSYKEFEAKHMGSRDDVAARIDKDTNQKLEIQKREVAQREGEITSHILDLICDIKTQLHRNYRTDAEIPK